jgi:hypothetical protein
VPTVALYTKRLVLVQRHAGHDRYNENSLYHDAYKEDKVNKKSSIRRKGGSFDLLLYLYPEIFGGQTPYGMHDRNHRKIG